MGDGEKDLTSDPVWSPDGEWIAYVADANGTDHAAELMIAHPNGSGARSLAPVIGTNSPSKYEGNNVTWSPDSKKLALVSTTPGPETAAATGDPMVFTRYNYHTVGFGEGFSIFNDNRRQHIFVIVGRFGAYVQLGETPEKGSKEKPRRASLMPGMSEKSVTLDEALKLLALPRELGTHPDGGLVVAGQGRYGPYVKHGDEFRSLDDHDDVFTIQLPRALELLAAPKKSRRRQAAAKTVLRALGPHPQSGAQINLLAGRYGPYVTDGTTNASLPKGSSPEQLTLEQAVELLAARAGAPKKAPRRAAGRKRKTPAGVS